MTSPMLTVLILAVLWLIVVVPMVVRRKDARAGERSIARFGSAMRALGARRSESIESPVSRADGRPETTGSSSRTVTEPVARRPVPASKESLMYPPDRHEMSDARRQMMTRRRRSLTTLGAGSVLLLLVAVLTGSTFAWILEVMLLVSLGGYLAFLRSQARRDRDRREHRRERAVSRSTATGYDATAAPESRPLRPVENAVRIDEDDVELDHLDTVDLTGLYSDVEFDDVPIRRAG